MYHYTLMIISFVVQCIKYFILFFFLEMIASLAEMESAKVPLDARDFCTHMLLNLRGCIREHFPFNHHCHHEREEYYECQYHE